MSERRWFLLEAGGGRSGPKSTTEIIRALLDERIAAETKVCVEGSDTWQEVRTVEEFRIAAKAVRATVQRRMSSRPPPGYVQAALKDDEDEVRTQYFTPGADAARLAALKSPARAPADDDDDDEDVRTRYFQPGAGDVRPSPAPAAPVRHPPAAPHAAPPPVARRGAPPPSVPRAVPPPSVPRAVPPPAPLPPARAVPVISRALPKLDQDDDEDEVETAYFQPGVGEDARRPGAARAVPSDDDEEQEVKTQYFQPGVPSAPTAPASVPRAAPPAQTARQPQPVAMPVPPQQPVAMPMPQQPMPPGYASAQAPYAPAPALQQQPGGLPPVPPSTAVGPNAMTVLMPAVRSNRPSFVLIIAGLAAFLIALLVASGVAWLVMMRQ